MAEAKLVGYYCRTYAAQKALSLRTPTTSDEANAFVLSLLDRKFNFSYGEDDI